MKQTNKTGALWRQGDILFRCLRKLPAGLRKKRASGIVAEGETSGHVHQLDHLDFDLAEVLEIEKALYVHVRKSSISVEDRKGATFVHQEHGPITLPPGNYEVVTPRQYTPAKIVPVRD